MLKLNKMTVEKSAVFLQRFSFRLPAIMYRQTKAGRYGVHLPRPGIA